jgi:hypothetical protein
LKGSPFQAAQKGRDARRGAVAAARAEAAERGSSAFISRLTGKLLVSPGVGQ